MPVTLRFSKILWLGAFFAVSVKLLGQNSVTPQGGEFSILGGLPGDQVWPSLALSPSAGYIVWQDNAIEKNGTTGIGGAMLDSSFDAGTEFRVNNNRTKDQIFPKVQLLANNDMIAVWQSAVAGTPDIYARWAGPKKEGRTNSGTYGTNFYTADVRVNTYLPGTQMSPQVAALPDGSAIVTWASWGQDGSMFGVYARRMLETGRGATPKEFLVNQYTSYNQRSPAVATLANGNYVIAWISEQERSSGSVDVYARIFTAEGVALTDEIAINSGSNPCATPAVAPLNDGGFTVVWAQKDLTTVTNGWDIWGRAFSASGSPEVSDFTINTFLYGDQYQPQIAASPSGSLVVWTSMGEDGSREGVYGRFLQGGTQAVGNEFLVNTTTISQQMQPTLAWDGVGRFLVVWTSFAGSTGFDLFGQAYSVSSSQ